MSEESKQRFRFNIVEDELTAILIQLRKERDAAHRELEEIEWGLEVCEKYLGKAYAEELEAISVGKTMRTWVGLYKISSLRDASGGD